MQVLTRACHVFNVYDVMQLMYTINAKKMNILYHWYMCLHSVNRHNIVYNVRYIHLDLDGNFHS